jgi:hypothetical protein
MEIIQFIAELIRSVATDNWEPTDTGYQLATRNYFVKLRKSPESNIELAVEGYDGKDIAKAVQKPAHEGANDDITLRLAYLYQTLEKKPIDRIGALDDVIRELRTDRGGR